MSALLSLLRTLRTLVRSRLALQLEILALRHQSLSQGAVVRHFSADEVPIEMRELVHEIDSFGQAAVADA
jgi:hypothetical protein